MLDAQCTCDITYSAVLTSLHCCQVIEYEVKKMCYQYGALCCVHIICQFYNQIFLAKTYMTRG